MTEHDHEVLAAEYALGLLTAQEAARAESMIANDPDFATRVEAWRQRMSEFDSTAPAQPPSEDLWQGIEASVERIAVTSPESASAIQQVKDRFKTRIDVLWQDIAAWRAFGLASAAAALMLAIGLNTIMREAARTPVMVAVMMSDQSRPLAVVNAFRDGRIELVSLQELSPPEGKALQVWTLWDRARGPVSVGLLDALRSVPLKVDGLPTTAPDQLFEITLEPTGGSPTGRPTGPILMKGNASRTGVGI